MSEAQELKEANKLILLNEKAKAAPILWKLYRSKDQNIKLDAALSLLITLDHLTENQKLLEVTEEAIKTASDLQKMDVRAYLLTQKATFLFSELNFLVYRQRNLMLAAGVFEWIDFSLEKEKKEFETISIHRKKLEEKIYKLEMEASELVNSSTNHYLRGHIFMGLAQLHISRFLNHQLDFVSGGRIRSMIANIYFIRRWNLNKFIIYDKSSRKNINESKRQSFSFFEKAATEFKAGHLNSDLAYAYYNLATNLTLTFNFTKSKKFLSLAKQLAQKNNEKILLAQIGELEKQIKDKNKHLRNYVEEFGLDLPSTQ